MKKRSMKKAEKLKAAYSAGEDSDAVRSFLYEAAEMFVDENFPKADEDLRQELAEAYAEGFYGEPAPGAKPGKATVDDKSIVSEIIDILFLDVDSKGEFYNKDKEWGSGAIGHVADVIRSTFKFKGRGRKVRIEQVEPLSVHAEGC